MGGRDIPAGGILVQRFGYAAWQQVDCAAAGRDLTADEWRALTDLTVPESLAC